MKHRDRILAGTAIGILIAASSMGAHAMQASSAKAKVEQSAAPIILAQAAEEGEKPSPKTAEEKPAAPEPKAAEERPAKPERKAVEERSAKPEPKAAEERAMKPERRAVEEKPAKPERKAVEDRPAKPKPKAAEDRSTKPERKAAEEKPAKPERKAVEERSAKPEPKAAEERATKPERRAVEEKPEPKAAEEKPAKSERKAAEDKAAERKSKAADEKPASSELKAGEEREKRTPKAVQRKGEKAQPSDDAAGTGEQQDQDAAPMLDSQKDAAQSRDAEGRRDGEARRDRGDRDRNAERDGNRRDRNAEREGNRDRRDRDRAERRPDSDRAAQRDIDVSIQDVQRLDQEEGRRIDRSQFRDFRRRDGAEVIKKLGDRTLIQFNNRIIVEDHSHERIRRHARDVYYEELPDQLRREVIVRPNGTKIITVRNSYGDIVSRTRIVNGQRYVLVYSGENSRRWHDPAEDLPPLEIDIPRSEYILESERVSDPDRYYQFLDQPPVVPVEQLYTIDQVRYSARVRDMVRRVDLDTINFETGSADISQSELPQLEAIATAIQRMIDENPAETFLIEGHTDAVGSDDSNLVLSDERAESVAAALTDAYEIPPENLFTQGYGEQYLKVDTEGAARENRRVAIRRITPLVSPVASAEQ